MRIKKGYKKFLKQDVDKSLAKEFKESYSKKKRIKRLRDNWGNSKIGIVSR
jgi:hypothetical protein